MDVGFKLEIEPKRALLQSSKFHSVITFTLKLCLDYVTENDI